MLWSEGAVQCISLQTWASSGRRWERPGPGNSNMLRSPPCAGASNELLVCVRGKAFLEKEAGYLGKGFKTKLKEVYF